VLRLQFFRQQQASDSRYTFQFGAVVLVNLLVLLRCFVYAL